eukprot:CAMPEP_0182496394 /NCGR_PEP_ID=MMETSP1321-20130603/5043_1 /TAXON_ID=91990 /ORGANISM="Bolidomonas sp., Strain RCC1657" /LENGTH=1494 /DNA_ID=CAMNT_0024700001 /DNA_START=461 /DNA_END=4945 /DNA_ORIENTATION=-
MYGILFSHGVRENKGSFHFGGALRLEDGAKVSLISCSFTSNSAQGGGAIFLNADENDIWNEPQIQLEVIVTTFSSNEVTSCEFWNIGTCGADIGVSKHNSVANIQSGCPDYWSGSPEQGANLDPSETWEGKGVSGSVLKGDLKSFDVGTCTPPKTCPVGTKMVVSRICVDCEPAKFSIEGTSPSCSGCPAGKYLSNPAAADESSACSTCDIGQYSGISSASCSNCPAGKRLTNATSGDEISACTSCDSGQYSGPASVSCADCAAGKRMIHKDTGDEPSACADCDAGKYSSSASVYCTVCSAGQYSGTSSATCSSCAAGKYLFNRTAADPSSACSICQAGTYSNAASAACTVCKAGKYNEDKATSADSHLSCTACPFGKKLEDNSTQVTQHDSSEDCIECNPATFSNNPEGAAYCTACPSGKVSPSGARECSFCPSGYDCSGVSTVMCPIGQFSNSTTEGCVPCQKGSYCPGGTDQRKCQAGTFQNISSKSFCLPCPAGKYQQDEGKDACVGCPAGHFCPERTVNPIACGGVALFCPPNSGSVQSAGEGNYTIPLISETTTKREGQAFCEAGHYCVAGDRKKCRDGTWSGPNSTFCTPCSQYMEYSEEKMWCVCKESFVELKGGTCSCQEGSTLVDDQCIACEDGRYKGHVGTGSCTVCDAVDIKGAFETVPGAKKNSSASCACGVGKFSKSPDEDNPSTLKAICKDCADVNLPKGVNCSRVGLTLKTLPMNDGYWRSSSDSHNIVECENPASCVHVSDEELCADGHTGPVCSVCKDGFSKNSVGVCESCASVGVSIGFYTLCGIILMSATYLALRKMLGNGNVNMAAATKEITKMTADDKHWTKRIKTKLKILTSFYQIISTLPATLAIKFPEVYETFTSAVSNVVNFDAIGLISFGCIIPQSLYGFYGSFLVTTITPIFLSCFLLLSTSLQVRNLDPYAANKLLSSRFTLFYGLTYLIFASTTTMSFTSFLCKTYGDDMTEYLVADRSIDCNSSFHKRFELFSLLMILIYPVGITTMYTYQLVKFKDAVKDGVRRDEDQTIQHISFLWKDYRPEVWWFEIYECFRRLSFSGMLVFFEPGSASQLCFSIILALISSLVYAYYRPFEKTEENMLAQTSTISIFLTLLAGIMVKLKSALLEANETEFGFVLILVNTLIFAMVGLGFVGKPFTKALQKMQRIHVHDGPLKGVKDVDAVDSFVDYFRRLAKSNDKEAAWMRLELKHWGGKRKKAKEWLNKTGAVADWRSGSGDGPIDQARVKFWIEADVERALAYSTSTENQHTKSAGSFLYEIDKGKDWRQIYRAIKMPWPLRQRDFVYTEHVRRLGKEVVVCTRSSAKLNNTMSADLSWKWGRKRAEMKLGGYLFSPCSNGGTDVVFCVDVDLGGWFAIDYFHRKIAPSYLKGVVDEYRAFSEKLLASSGNADSDPPQPVPQMEEEVFTAVSMTAQKGEGGKGLKTPLLVGGSDEVKASTDDRVNREIGRAIRAIKRGLDNGESQV